MSADPAVLPATALPSSAPPAISHASRHFTRLLALLTLALCMVLAIHYATVDAMVTLWVRSQTFAHGFLILPIVVWLVWRQRIRLATLPLQPSRLALLLLAVLGAAWLLAAVANVQVLQQYCVMAMVAATVGAIFGRQFAQAIAFPLCYLLLAVPFGEIFVPPLIEFTAGFTVNALQLSGIPVFRENNYLTLPSGNWSVVDACSGLRYVIASVALGTLYAYLNYRGLLRRLAFIVVSLVLPVFANGLRAYMIVLIGHWSGMRLAVGIDHLIYGWVFFGLVSLLLFWCGSFWRDQTEPMRAPPADSMTSASSAAAGYQASAPVRAWWMPHARAAGAAILIVACWPLLAALALRPAAPDPYPAPLLALAAPPQPWRVHAMQDADWHVLHMGQPQRITNKYDDGNIAVSLQLTWYRHQAKGAELLAPVRRRVVPGLPQWHEISSVQRQLNVDGRRFSVRETIVQAADAKLLVWRWYRQAGTDTSSPQLLKLLLAKAKLLGGADSGAEIALAAPYEEQPELAAAAMQRLLAAMLPAIDQGLNHVAAR